MAVSSGTPLNIRPILRRWRRTDPPLEPQAQRRSSSSTGLARMPSGLMKLPCCCRREPGLEVTEVRIDGRVCPFALDQVRRALSLDDEVHVSTVHIAKVAKLHITKVAKLHITPLAVLEENAPT
jgi:hypothetical protein